MIQLENIGLKRDQWVLRNISFSISQGDLIGIIGSSGIGKTTLLKIISGLLDASEGTVFFDKERILGPSIKLIPGHKDIQLVHQDFGLDPYHTVEENVREKILNLHKEDQVQLVEELLGLVELNHLRDRKALVLSGGEQQRLALARALACEPRVLLLDEPTNGLDPEGIKQMRELIISIAQEGKTIIISSHILDEIQKMCSHYCILKNGKKLMQGSISDLSTSKNEFLVNADNLTEIETSIKKHPLFKESKREVEKLKISFSGEINGMELNKYLKNMKLIKIN